MPRIGQRNTEKKLGLTHSGSRAWNWMGEKVLYRGLHKWVRDHKEGGEKCEICGSKIHIDLANISGKYDRDISDWRYLCRKCHMISDGRYKELLRRNNND